MGLLYSGRKSEFLAPTPRNEIGLTESSGSSILGLLSRLNARKISVRPCLNIRVRTICM